MSHLKSSSQFLAQRINVFRSFLLHIREQFLNLHLHELVNHQTNFLIILQRILKKLSIQTVLFLKRSSNFDRFLRQNFYHYCIPSGSTAEVDLKPSNISFLPIITAMLRDQLYDLTLSKLTLYYVEYHFLATHFLKLLLFLFDVE